MLLGILSGIWGSLGITGFAKDNDFVTLAHTHSEEQDEAADTEVSPAEEAEPDAPQDITPDADTPPSEK